MNYCEFAGLPASGKSTICELLKSLAKKNQKTIHNIHDLSTEDYIGEKVAKFFISTPARRSSFRMLKFQLHYAEFMDKIRPEISKNLAHWQLLLEGSAGYEYIKNEKVNDIFAYDDEGFVHRLVDVYARIINSENSGRITSHSVSKFTRIMELVPLPDAWIFIEITPERCFERMVTRRMQAKNLDGSKRKRVENMISKRKGRAKDFIPHAELYKIAQDELNKRGAQIIKIDGEADPRQSAISIFQTLITKTVN